MNFIFVLLAVLITAVTAYGSYPHLPLDSAGSHYQSFLKQNPRFYRAQRESIRAIIKMGERNLQWLQVLNDHMDEKISLTNPENMQAFPIEAPRIYNEKRVISEFMKLKSQLPRSIHNVLFSDREYPKQLPVEKSLYAMWALKVDRAYQIAARWTMMRPYLDQLAARKHRDVRGYYILKDIKNLDAILRGFDKLSDKDRQIIARSLVVVCINTRKSEIKCQTELKKAITEKQVLEFKNRYWSRSEQIYNSYFKIPRKYPAVIWNKNSPYVARVPFKPVNNPTIARFLKYNLEDEWRFGNWRLIVDFSLKGYRSVEVKFKPGVTPHVPSLGSNLIYMDANAPISEWDVQWTIRHEFGHTLGFPDCYHEFYDRDRGVIIGYQIDITDLMCSRRGKLKQRHFDQMKEAYFRR